MTTPTTNKNNTKKIKHKYTEIIILVLILFILACIAANTKPIVQVEPETDKIPTSLDGSSWTATTYLEDDKETPVSDYYKNIRKESDFLNAVIRFDKNQVQITKYMGNGKIETEFVDWTRTNDTIIIDGQEYKYDKIEDTITGNGSTYIRDYGIKLRSFSLKEAYKNNKKIYSSDNLKDVTKGLRTLDKKNNYTDYEFSINDGSAICFGEESVFFIACEEDTTTSKITMQYSDGDTETAIFDKDANILTIEHDGIKRIFTRLEIIEPMQWYFVIE